MTPIRRSGDTRHSAAKTLVARESPMVAPRRTFLVSLLVVALPCGLAVLSATGQSPRSGAAVPVIDTARAYVEDYKNKLTFIIADEDYTQEIRDQVPLDPAMPKGRTMKSEMYFLFAPQTEQWLAVRDVISVDGQPLTDRPNVSALLATMRPSDVAMTVATHNSRFNIGRTVRNVNEPTLGLLILDADRQSSVVFDVKRTDVDRGTRVATIAFHEQGPRTLIVMFHDALPAAASSSGEIVAEEQTGRVRRTEIKTKLGSVSVDLATTYVAEPALDMWVPATFREHYEDGVYQHDAKNRFGAPGYEEILCEARYSHFRRFETTGHIKRYP
jgi:hypothetical protein